MTPQTLDAVFFLSTVAAILGQFSDARTTDVGLQGGQFTEENSLMAKVIKKIGISPVYAIKCGVVPVFGVVAVGIGHEHIGIIMEAGVAAVGFVFGVLNYLKLRKAGHTFSEIFVP